MKILPLIARKDIEVAWISSPYHPRYNPDTEVCRASLLLHSETRVSSHEFSHGVCMKQIAEKQVVADIFHRLYPSELIRELRDIQCELALRSDYRYGRDEYAALRERLAVVTAQLSDRNA